MRYTQASYIERGLRETLKKENVNVIFTHTRDTSVDRFYFSNEQPCESPKGFCKEFPISSTVKDTNVLLEIAFDLLIHAKELIKK